MNYFTKTELESHEAAKEEFRKLMPLFAHLSYEEGKSLVHLIHNNKRLDLLQALHSGQVEQELAKKVEEENFNQKNRYRLEKEKLDYADKKRMAIDSTKLKTVLAHHD